MTAMHYNCVIEVVNPYEVIDGVAKIHNILKLYRGELYPGYWDSPMWCPMWLSLPERREDIIVVLELLKESGFTSMIVSDDRVRGRKFIQY